MSEFVDVLGREWVDISSEIYRQYEFTDGSIARIDGPLKLHISESGGHRIYAQGGKCYYIPAGWISIEWQSKDGSPQFVF